MNAEALTAGGWAAEQLTAYLSSLSEAGDRCAIVRQALHLAAEALEAEVAAFLEGGDTYAVIGFRPDRAPLEWLREVAEKRPERVELPGGLGYASVLVAPSDAGGEKSFLLVARVGAAAFSLEERNLFRGMSRVLGLSLKVAETIEAEREVRTVIERQAAENASLLQKVQERQALLERLSRIQRSITRGAPLPHVLGSIARGAAELIGADVVTLRRVDPNDPEFADVICSVGVAEDSRIASRVRVGAGASGRAIAENRLVVMHDYPNHVDAHDGYAAEGIQAAMAAPVQENGAVVGSLVVASRGRGRRYSQAEQDMLLSFADHASLAITDANAAQALRDALQAARHDAMHDVLTGLPNRALLKDRLGRAWSRSRRNGRLLALLFLDLDNFKHINDSLGHDAGDKLLVGVGKRLRDSLRPSDTIVRLGGDEFAVLIEDLAGITEAEDVANRLLTALTLPLKLGSRSVAVNASIGIALSDDLPESRSLLLSADLAMYEAKRLGGGQFVRFLPDMHRATMARLNTEHDLRHAIESDQLVLHYQPIVDLARGDICSVEALVRWNHPSRGLVLPGEFIPVAEASRLINALGEHVLRKACAEASTWPESVEVTVNVSPRQVDAQLPDVVRSILLETGLAPHRLTLEVTEGTAMADVPDTISVIDELHRLGVKFAVDDFGTGYSSLARLGTLAIDMLKIDRSFVARLDDDTRGHAIVGAIIALSRSAGFVAVAEGVETEQQLQALRTLGCDRVQGYLLGRPMPAELLAQRLGSARRKQRTGVHQDAFLRTAATPG